MRFILFLLILLILPLGAAQAATTVSVFLYRADPMAKDAVEGFKEVYKWRMNVSDEWRRFEYMASTMPKGKKEEISPFVRKPAELLVLSIKDENGVTGQDYYLTPDGIMITAITSRNSFFEDRNNFFGFLKEEVSLRSSFEKFPVRYRINDTLPNPAWLVNTQKDVNLYDGFMRKIPQVTLSNTRFQSAFEEKGNFTLIPNYPKAPADFVTVGPSGIRLSKTYSEDRFVKDEKNYYKFFYDLTMDNKQNDSNLKTEDEKKKLLGNF